MTKKNSETPNTIFSDHIPPQAGDIEEAVIGAILLANDQNTRFALTFLKPEDFFFQNNKNMFEAASNLFRRGDDIDIMILAEELKKMNVLEEIGGPYTIALSSQKVSTTAHLNTHVKILKQKSLQRQIIMLCQEKIKDAYLETKDIFKIIDETQLELSLMTENLDRKGAAISAKNVVDDFLADIHSDKKHSRYVWETGDPRFDKKVGISPDKIVLVAGGAKHGKSKYVASKMFYLFDHYDDVACYWVSLEDSAKYIAANYLAQKLYMKPKDIVRRNYTPETRKVIQEHLNRFNSFDIVFQEQAAKSWKIKSDFKNFCKQREGKLCILIVDNILALSDREDFKGAENSMYDYVMNQMLNIRQETKGFIIPIHHYKDSQQEESRIKNAFRPRLMDMKGTEAFRRIPNAVLLINNPGKFDELMNEYGDNKEFLRYLYIVDTGANREDTSDDGTALIRYVHTLDFNIFIPIEL